ncbi:MAG: class I SAM-dependent methyltransferase [Bacillota bacterium]|jgi:SAM-dependent methyltransferase
MSKKTQGCVFDQAEVWDGRYRRIPKRFYRDTPISGKIRDVGEFLLSCGVKDVLDVGCGVGRWALHFSRLGMVPTGVDISPVAISLAKSLAQEQSRQIDYRVASACQMPFPDAYFDGVVASSIIDHLTLSEGTKAMSEIHRVLKPGGFLFVSLDAQEPDASLHETLPDGSWVYTEGNLQGVVWRHYTGDEARALLGGFQEILWETTPTGDRWIYAKKK